MCDNRSRTDLLSSGWSGGLDLRLGSLLLLAEEVAFASAAPDAGCARGSVAIRSGGGVMCGGLSTKVSGFPLKKLV